MVDWGRRVNALTWIALALASTFWVVGLAGLAAFSRIHQNANTILDLQWWIIWLQLGALGIAAVVQYKQWHGARGVVMGLMCVLTATLMTQTDVANTQRLALVASLSGQGIQTLQGDTAAVSSSGGSIQNWNGSPSGSQTQQVPVLPAELVQGITGIISGLDSSMNQRSAAAAASTAPAPADMYSAVINTAARQYATGANSGTAAASGGAVSGSGTGSGVGNGNTPSGSSGGGGGSGIGNWSGGAGNTVPTSVAPAGAGNGGGVEGGERNGNGNPRGSNINPGGPGGGGGGGPNPAGPAQNWGNPGSGIGQGQGGGGGGNMNDGQQAAGRRRLLSVAETTRQRADVVFIGFLFMTLLDLALLVLFGLQHPHSKERSPRVYISGVDQQQQQISVKDSSVDGVALQVTAVPMRQGSLRPESRQPSGVSVRLENCSRQPSVTMPLRQPSRQLSGSVPFTIIEHMDGRQASNRNPLKMARMGSRNMTAEMQLQDLRHENAGEQPQQYPNVPLAYHQRQSAY